MTGDYRLSEHIASFSDRQSSFWGTSSPIRCFVQLSVRPSGKRVSRTQSTPTNRDHDDAKHLSLTGARAGVGWTRRLA